MNRFTVHALLIAGMLLSPRVNGGVIFTPLVAFNYTNGAGPQAGLVLGNDGNFYGTTVNGGTNNPSYGTVFQMTTNGTLTNLLSFNNTNGAYPVAGLALGQDGNFYGTTYYGGSSNVGTIFKMAADGTLTTSVSFAGTNGANPQALLAQGSDGNFYGTTAGGGTNGPGYGTIFLMTTNGTLTNLLSFNNTNGAYPVAGLALGRDGNFYGTTAGGGTNGGGYGTIFKMTTDGALTSLVSFSGTNGAFPGNNPYGGLVQGVDGNFYGTTYYGGSSNAGTLFKVTTNGAFASMYAFTGGDDGANPYSGMVQGRDGLLYGTTEAGGSNSINQGTIFQITTNDAFASLYSFTNGNDGAVIDGGLVSGVDGDFYGTTYQAGANHYGTVFRLSVPMPPVFISVLETGG
ncbi:MAG: choice-of-anchor tandem repeat GloVer-containing protein, partial [Verrucomicrobiota bacterium]